MGFNKWWNKLDYWKRGGIIGLIMAITIELYTYNYKGQCWHCIPFWMPFFPFEYFFELIDNGILQVILGYSFLLLEYTLIGLLVGKLLEKIKKK